MNIKETIDRGGVLDAEIKEREKELKEIKASLMKYATQYRKHEAEGENFKVSITDTTSRNLEVNDLHNYLKETDRIQFFFPMVKVAISSANKFLSDLELVDAGMETVHKPFSRCSFKKK